MLIKSADFLGSAAAPEQFPQPKFPEYAFIGRSNVGKSSLINMLLKRKGLAKTSATPGKTRLINHFAINGSWYIADLPGYGYAKVSKDERHQWKQLIDTYILKRPNLLSVFCLIDIRHAALKNDLEFMTWLGENGIPFILTFTKCDKITPAEITTKVEAYQQTLGAKWEALPQCLVTSAVNASGRNDILDIIITTNKIFQK